MTWIQYLFVLINLFWYTVFVEKINLQSQHKLQRKYEPDMKMNNVQAMWGHRSKPNKVMP